VRLKPAQNWHRRCDWIRVSEENPDKEREIIMAYIIGLLSPEEEQILIERGWEIEEAPDCLSSDHGRLKMVWVDSDMFAIMSGPDWDTTVVRSQESEPA
jgi:hypothetical protein